MNLPTDRNVLRQACRILLVTLKKSSQRALGRQKRLEGNRRNVLVFMIFASSIYLGCGAAVYAQAQSAGVNSQQLSDDFLNALINLPRKHQGQISYDEVDAMIMRRLKCVDDTHSESMGKNGDDKNIKYVYVKSHCLDGSKVVYTGESKTREGGNFKYDLDIAWFPSKATCIPAEHVEALIKADDWKAVQPVWDQSPGGTHQSNMNIPNYMPYQSSGAGSATLGFQWSLPAGRQSMLGVPIGQSCLSGLEFSEPQARIQRASTLGRS
ncbi:hypothetical protein [Dyella mobilis]|uniref:Uncharacterized protein n=1 Tax=Dyella mobilis TaxID=1849582 RepID=A0ABS2KKZ6_9GAMM|nr:hypothetical protein [Dyella mobilis]MBM7131093.1 hypothetical protein [Dyella mobilis]